MPKYRKKPVVVEAYQTDTEMDIATLEGVMHASVGDYIITGVNGEQYPCKPDIFAKTYEPVDVLRCGQWISVEDRLPRYAEEVLVAVASPMGDHDFHITRFGRWNDKYWETCDTTDVYDVYPSTDAGEDRVYAWMPLPEPPEEERL